MNKADTIKKCFNILESEYGIQSDQKKEVWTTILRNYPADKIMKATIMYIKTARFFPFVSDIIKLIEGSNEGQAEKIWSNLIKDIEEIGYHGTPSKWEKDGIVIETIEMLGGWQKICDIKEDEVKWIRKEFIKLYGVNKQKIAMEGRKEIKLMGKEIEAPRKERENGF